MSRTHRHEGDYGYSSPSSSSRSRSRSPRYNRRNRQLPQVLTDLFGEYKCRLCCVEMSSSIISKMHYGGKQHFKKMKRFLTEWCAQNGLPMYELDDPANTKADNDTNDFCEYCNVQYTSLNDKLIHISGRKHKKNEADPANAMKKIKTREPYELPYPDLESFVTALTLASTSKCFLCEVCNVKTVSYDQLQTHLAGRKHREKLEKANSLGRKTTSKPFYCKDCDVGLDTSQSYKMHLDGRTHAKALQKKAEGKRSGTLQDCKLMCDFCPFVGNIKEHDCDESLKELKGEDYESKYACPSCIMVFDSELELEDHKNSRRHLIAMLNKDKGDKVVEELSHFYCRYCKLQTSDNADYTQHIFSERHGERYSLMVDLESRQIFHCQICDLYMDRVAKDEHLEDRTHVKKSVLADVHSHLTACSRLQHNPKQFLCADCSESFHDFLNYSKHLLSDRHVHHKMQQALESLKS